MLYSGRRRGPTRKTSRPHDRQAAIDLVKAAESGRVACLTAEQAIEFSDHDLRQVLEQVERIYLLSAVFGAPGIVDPTHLDDHVARTGSHSG